MKAKIKATGEIVNLASYATITLDQCDSWGNPIELKPEEVELIHEQTMNKYWQDVRERAAIAALQGLLANPCRNRPSVSNDYVELAIDYADALIKQLKNNKNV